MPSHIDVALNAVPNGRPRYFIGREETLQPKMLARPSMLMTLPMGTDFDFARLILKHETILLIKKK
jgi:hypothetical protein